MRSGNKDLKTGTLRWVGFGGNDWTSMASSTTKAYFFGFNDPELGPSNGPIDRWEGFPVRCLASDA